MTNYSGQCSCGKVKFTCNGDPIFTQYCHCNKCREVAALSENSKDKVGYGYTAAYLTHRFILESDENNLQGLIRGSSKLMLCSTCKCLIYGISLDPAKQGGIGVSVYNFEFPNGLPDSFKPVRHIWYANRIVNFEDDLPKFKDAPKEQFGSGELL